jgi:hypothetical protein
MEPHREDQQEAEAGARPKPKRFRIVKLEERIAPSQGGNATHNSCGAFTCVHCSHYTCGYNTCYCTY